ncbi:hypothetical protein RF11_04534 [Thelohanellus kitauei]|uniref:Uncharacterized protein n=1 Tax=Thelohanellus kitauei TaxID=669202 RepID=A0A0C2MU25_THEKT|nr:hypothetical protein RF11_04534 [Thelohanellus kitauei]
MFSQNGTLTDDEVDEIIKFDAMNFEKKSAYFAQNDHTISEILIKILNRVSVERIQHYILVVLDTFIRPDFTSSRHFIDLIKRLNLNYQRVGYDLNDVFLILLNQENEITSHLVYTKFTLDL